MHQRLTHTTKNQQEPIIYQRYHIGPTTDIQSTTSRINLKLEIMFNVINFLSVGDNLVVMMMHSRLIMTTSIARN